MSRQHIAVNAVFVGLAALIPIPFVDDLVRRAMMRGVYEAIGESRGVELDDTALHELSRGDGFSVLGCLLGPIWYLVKKISKKIIYFLSIKDALDWSAEAAVRAELVLVALDRGLLPDRAELVRAAMDASWKARGGSPLTRTLTARDAPPLDWHSSEGSVVPLVHTLARRGAGALVVEHFGEELDRRLEEAAAQAEGAAAEAAAEAEAAAAGAATVTDAADTDAAKDQGSGDERGPGGNRGLDTGAENRS